MKNKFNFDTELALQKKRSLPAPVKANSNLIKSNQEINTENRTVTVVANTMNFFDYDMDVLLKGCANRSISQRGAKTTANDKIAHLLYHDMNKQVGKSLDEREELVEGKLALVCESYLPETEDGEDTLIKYNVGMYNQHSIGFRYKLLDFIEKGTQDWDKIMSILINPEDADEIGYLWAVKEIKWWEYSTVTFGANKLTPYIGTKSENKIEIADIISQKIAILAQKAMRKDIGNKEAFNYELSQLQQMIYELAEMSPSLKDIHKDSSKEDTQKVVLLSDFSKKLNFKL